MREAESDPRKNLFPCRIVTIDSIGPYVRIEADCGSISLTVRMTERTAGERELDTEMAAWVAIRPRVVHLLPAEALR